MSTVQLGPAGTDPGDLMAGLHHCPEFLSWEPQTFTDQGAQEGVLSCHPLPSIQEPDPPVSRAWRQTGDLRPRTEALMADGSGGEPGQVRSFRQPSAVGWWERRPLFSLHSLPGTCLQDATALAPEAVLHR